MNMKEMREKTSARRNLVFSNSPHISPIINYQITISCNPKKLHLLLRTYWKFLGATLNRGLDIHSKIVVSLIDFLSHGTR
jgi:hypothetical protein